MSDGNFVVIGIIEESNVLLGWLLKKVFKLLVKIFWFLNLGMRVELVVLILIIELIREVDKVRFLMLVMLMFLIVIMFLMFIVLVLFLDEVVILEVRLRVL